MTTNLKDFKEGSGFASLEATIRFVGERKKLKDGREVQDAMLVGEDGGVLGFTLWPELIATGVGDGDTVEIGNGYVTLGKYAPWKGKLVANLKKGEPLKVIAKEVGTPPPLPKVIAKAEVEASAAKGRPMPSEEEAGPGGPTIWDIKDKGASLGGCLHDAAAIMAACIQADWDWRMVVDGRPRTIAELDAEGLTLAEAVFELACRLEEQKATYIERWAAGGANIAEAPGELAPSVASKMPPAREPPAALPTSPDEFYPMCCKAFGLDRTWVNQLLRLALSKLDGVPVEQGQLGKRILAREGTWAKAFQDLAGAGFDWAQLLDEAKAEVKSKAK